ncbi:hypothetical protein ACOSQ2_002366 [Xanthoceras sorbifolium]
MSLCMEAQAWEVWIFRTGLQPSAGFKINIDAAFDLHLERHSIVSAATQVFEGLVEVELADAKAVLLGLQLGVDDDLCDVVLESDSSNVIKLIYGEPSFRNEKKKDRGTVKKY